MKQVGTLRNSANSSDSSISPILKGRRRWERNDRRQEEIVNQWVLQTDLIPLFCDQRKASSNQKYFPFNRCCAGSNQSFIWSQFTVDASALLERARFYWLSAASLTGMTILLLYPADAEATNAEPPKNCWWYTDPSVIDVMSADPGLICPQSRSGEDIWSCHDAQAVVRFSRPCRSKGCFFTSPHNRFPREWCSLLPPHTADTSHMQVNVALVGSPVLFVTIWFISPLCALEVNVILVDLRVALQPCRCILLCCTVVSGLRLLCMMYALVAV